MTRWLEAARQAPMAADKTVLTDKTQAQVVRSAAESNSMGVKSVKSVMSAGGIPVQATAPDGQVNDPFRHGRSVTGSPLTWTGRIASLDEWRRLSDWEASIGSKGHNVDADASNFLLSVVRGVQPRDELEAMLAVQMGAIHQATMMMARRLNHVDNLQQQDSAERTLNKLARTYAMQMEALKRYRTSGEQKVTVEHVTVNAGGQAIVGAVAHGGRGIDGK